MSVNDFFGFITSDQQLLSFGRCVRSVNLVRLHEDQDASTLRAGQAAQGRGAGAAGRGAAAVPRGTSVLVRPRVALVLDAEHCLDRLYGGHFSDWCCGGQWANMLDFLATLFNVLHQANVQLAIFLNGALEAERFREWTQAQLKLKENIRQSIRHVSRRGTPPPKAWWVPPCSTHTVLRHALKSLNCSVFCSLDDHHLEVMSFCWENGYHGVLADDSEYAIFNPSRYFSAKALKLSFQGDVTSTEYNLDEVARALDLNPNRFGLLGTLLGNHILKPKDLEDFHLKLVPELKKNNYEVVGFDRVIRAVVNYIRTLPKTDDFDRIGTDVFGSPNDPRVKKLRSSLKYYQSGSCEGYAKQRPKNNTKKKQGPLPIPIESAREDEKKEKRESDSQRNIVERIALDLDELDLNEAISAATNAIGKETLRLNISAAAEATASSDKDDKEKSSDSKSSDTMSVLQALASGVAVEPSEEGKYPIKSRSGAGCPLKPICIPDVHPEVLRTSMERHRLAQMSPLVYHLMTRGEIKLPVLMEDDQVADFPRIHLLYQPLRQAVYGILYNLHHKRFGHRQAEEGVKNLRKKAEECKKQAKKSKSEQEKEELLSRAETLEKEASEATVPELSATCIREWLPYNDYRAPEVVEAVELHWPVPTIQRLWFGSSLEDKQKRLRAFLTCLRCDTSPPLLVQANVPQHMLVLACVLRYIMSSPACIVLRRPELDALLVTAFSPELKTPRYLADMPHEVVSKRGMHIASLIMEGFEMAILANDTCGAPIPFQMCLPWTFFDGKLFAYKLRKAEGARGLIELCDGRVDLVYAIERMRAAILHGLVPMAGVNPIVMGHHTNAHMFVRGPVPGFGAFRGRGRGLGAAGGNAPRMPLGGQTGSIGLWEDDADAQRIKKNKKKADERGSGANVESLEAGTTNGREGEANKPAADAS